jgi:hypothetical protein
MKKLNPREVIGTKKQKCEREGTCVPYSSGNNYWGFDRARCKTCNRLIHNKKVK